MAFDGLKHNLAMLVVSITVTLGAILPTGVMAILITGIGLTGTLIFFFISPRLDARKKDGEMKQVV